MGPLLEVALPRQGQEPLTSVADWIRRANKVASYNSCATLVELVDVPHLSDLERALKLLPITAGVLRYLVTEKELGSLSELVRWFQARARGILDMKLYGQVGPIERLLLDDGFERENFLSVRHNVGAAIGALQQRATAKLGPRPNFKDTSARSAYDAQHDVVQSAELPALLGDMARLLESTSGVLFESFLAHVDTDPAAFDRRLADISPLIDELVAGRGPSQRVPSEVEIEAVSLVYGVVPGNVSQFWGDVVDRESDIAALQLASSYPMRWKQSQRELRAGAQLDDRGFSALSQLAGLANEFNQRSGMDMEAARAGLRPSRIGDKAADVPGLAAHMAVVCALVAVDTNVAAMLKRWESAHAAIAGGPMALELIEQTASFVATALPDALSQHLPARQKAMSDAFARLLAERLAPATEELRALPAQQHLSRSVQAVAAKLKLVFGVWAKKQDDKFASAKDGHTESELIGVVSKTPAAFFAKFAAALCTKADTDMWNEDRHSHLVVFDPVKRRLAGMAMLYVQNIPAIDASRPTLIIRALNPINAWVSEHEPTSMVDAFLEVAFTIARENDLAAVALPGNDGHMLSNVSALELDLRDRYVTKSVASRHRFQQPSSDGKLSPPWEFQTRFDCYAQGHGQVSSLHVLWISDQAELATPGDLN